MSKKQQERSAGEEPVTLQTVKRYVTEAQNRYRNSKLAVSEATAYTYLVWRHTLAPYAPSDGRQWAKELIVARAAADDQSNSQLELNRVRAKAFSNGKLPKSDGIFDKSLTASERKAERAQLTDMAKWSDEDWVARRKVSIESKEGASRFTAVVKLTLELDRPADGPIISRIARALEWVDSKFGQRPKVTATEIVKAIAGSGGFEEILHKQREIAGSDSRGERQSRSSLKSTTSENNALVDQAFASLARDTVNTAVPKASFAIDLPAATAETLVVSIGRYRKGNVELVAVVPVDDIEECDALLAKYRDELPIKMPSEPEFVFRTLALGKLVNEGRTSNRTQDGLVAGTKLKEMRALALMPHSKGIELLMSAVNADSSFVVTARPKSSGLGTVQRPFVMERQSLVELGRLLGDRAKRCLTSITPTPLRGGGKYKKSALTWVADNTALVAKKRQGGRREFALTDVADVQERPLDVGTFRPALKVSVGRAVLAKHSNELMAWSKAGAGDALNPLHLSFEAGALKLSIGKRTTAIPVEGSMAGAAEHQFSAIEFVNLMQVLARQETSTDFEVSVDLSGLLRVAWDDAYGTYNVYLPAIAADGTPKAGSLAPIGSASEQSAAA